jgi:glucosamine-6-phosphate deaminase
MKIIIAESYDEMSIIAATYIMRQIIAKPGSVLGLAAGNTPLGTYRELVNAYNRGEVDFSKTTLFSLDEYCNLPRDNPQSYHFFMNENLISHINVKGENTFIPDGMAGDIEQECSEYDNKIIEKGGIDLQILGIGENGHIGFNEPGSDFQAGTHLVKLKQSTVDANARYFKSSAEVPTTAISMGIKTILQSKMLVLLASGEKKADAIYKALKGEISPEVPASILQRHPNAVFIIEKNAAKLL